MRYIHRLLLAFLPPLAFVRYEDNHKSLDPLHGCSATQSVLVVFPFVWTTTEGTLRDALST